MVVIVARVMQNVDQSSPVKSRLDAFFSKSKPVPVAFVRGLQDIFAGIASRNFRALIYFVEKPSQAEAAVSLCALIWSWSRIGDSSCTSHGRIMYKMQKYFCICLIFGHFPLGGANHQAFARPAADVQVAWLSHPP